MKIKYCSGGGCFEGCPHSPTGKAWEEGYRAALKKVAANITNLGYVFSPLEELKKEEKANRIRDLPTMTQSEAIDLENSNKKAIDDLFEWREAKTDRYGDDLVSLLLYEFGTDPYISHGNRIVPPEHMVGLKAFQELDWNEQDKLVEEFVEKQ